MFNLSKDQIEQIKETKSIEELESKIREQNIALSKETISALYNTYCVNNSLLTEEELDNVTGGCGDDPVEEPTESGPKFKVNDIVRDSRGWRFIVRDIGYDYVSEEIAYSLEIIEITTDSAWKVGEIYGLRESLLFKC